VQSFIKTQDPSYSGRGELWFSKGVEKLLKSCSTPFNPSEVSSVQLVTRQLLRGSRFIQAAR